MKKENNISNIISREVLFSSSVQTANIISKFHIATILKGSCYFYVAFNPLSTLSDYIGFKSTMGGKTMILSMIQIPLLLNYLVYAMFNRQHTTLNNIEVMQQNTSRSVTCTFEMNVKGLIELMYQF